MEIDTRMNIPCLDLKEQHRQLKSEILTELENVYDNTSFSGGRYVEEFEQKFSAYCHVNHAIAVNNGTNALHLALLALNIGPGDEVILPGNTFIATAWAVSYVGATPVFVDCDNDTWQIDPREIEKSISKNTRAIIGVHLYGQPCDMDTLQSIAKSNNLFLVEDAAQSHGAQYKGTTTGSLGDISCFSFYPGKNLGACGEAGMVTTNNAEWANRIRGLRNHGGLQKYVHEEIGYNMRMSGFEAASLKVKLKYIDGWNNRRRQIAERYLQSINNDLVNMQVQPDFSSSVYHLFVITVDNREKAMEYLKANGIHAAMHYPIPCHLQSAYAHLNYQPGDLPNSEHLAAHCISLPMYAELTDDQVQHVIDTVNNYS